MFRVLAGVAGAGFSFMAGGFAKEKLDQQRENRALATAFKENVFMKSLSVAAEESQRERSLPDLLSISSLVPDLLCVYVLAATPSTDWLAGYQLILHCSVPAGQARLPTVLQPPHTHYRLQHCTTY